jgi:hypothetical protein
MDLKEIHFADMNWIHLAQDRVKWWAVVNTATKFSDCIKDGEFPDLSRQLSSS